MIDQEGFYHVQPVLIARLCGGWLAKTPVGWPLAIGVGAESEIDAKRLFSEALARWRSIKILPDKVIL